MARSRRRGTAEVTIEVPKQVAEEYIKVLRTHQLDERADDLEHSFRMYGADSVSFSLTALSNDVLEALIPATGNRNSVINLIKGFIRVSKNPKTKVADLRLLPDALAKYLITDAIDGWLYKSTGGGERIAYLVEKIEYHESDRQTKASVSMSLKANRASFSSDGRSRGEGLHTNHISWSSDEVVSKNVADLLLEAGYLKETKELRDEYNKYFELFGQYIPQRCKQFLASGSALDATDNYWRRSDMVQLDDETKVVNDEDLANRNITARADNNFWADYIKGLDEVGMFSEMPVHPYMLVFNLKLHENAWVHIGNVKPYVYDKTVKDKLVLPDEHRDLIDILTTDISVFSEDIVKGKSGGIAVLCYGKPGLGKTLTAEVYSELIEKPLYKVDAGQLGTTVEQVQTNLEIILKRATRWEAILLLDEADVYIRKRADDMQQNAIVAAFLRTLEYFSGLMFMTTNRAEDVDDAIVSRMIAVFRYETPTPEMRPKLWTVLAKQFDCKLEASLDELTTEFATASGRDIKQLLRLTKKYCTQKDVPMNIEALRICAMFRGIV